MLVQTTRISDPGRAREPWLAVLALRVEVVRVRALLTHGAERFALGLTHVPFGALAALGRSVLVLERALGTVRATCGALAYLVTRIEGKGGPFVPCPFAVCFRGRARALEQVAPPRALAASVEVPIERDAFIIRVAKGDAGA